MAQTITAFAKQNWTKGERFWEGSVPLTVEAVRIAIDRTSLTGPQVPDAVKLDVWLSQDGGATWEYLGGVGAPSGEVVIDGVTRTESGMQRLVPGAGNPQRRARVKYSITDAAVNTKLTVTLLP